jgi:hypothetical protein
MRFFQAAVVVVWVRLQMPIVIPVLWLSSRVSAPSLVEAGHLRPVKHASTLLQHRFKNTSKSFDVAKLDCYGNFYVASN